MRNFLKYGFIEHLRDALKAKEKPARYTDGSVLRRFLNSKRRSMSDVWHKTGFCTLKYHVAKKTSLYLLCSNALFSGDQKIAHNRNSHYDPDNIIDRSTDKHEEGTDGDEEPDYWM